MSVAAQMMSEYLDATAEKRPRTYLMSSSVNDCRLTAGQWIKAGKCVHVRATKLAKPTGGGNTGAISSGKSFGKGKNGQKKLAREMKARKMAR